MPAPPIASVMTALGYKQMFRFDPSVTKGPVTPVAAKVVASDNAAAFAVDFPSGVITPSVDAVVQVGYMTIALNARVPLVPSIAEKAAIDASSIPYV